MLVRITIEHGRIKSPRGVYGGQFTVPQWGELQGGLQLNGPLAPCAWPSSPPGARLPANLEADPLRAPIEEGGGLAKHF